MKVSAPTSVGHGRSRNSFISAAIVSLGLLTAFAGAWRLDGSRPNRFDPVSIVGMQSECEVVIHGLARRHVVRLRGTMPIHLKADTDRTQVLAQVSQFVYAISRSNSFMTIQLEDQVRATNDSFYCTLRTTDNVRDLQDFLAEAGYVAPSTDAPKSLSNLCEQASRERRGLWMLALPWPAELSWWTRHVQDRTNSFDTAAAEKVDLVVLIGHRRKGSTFYPLTPVVATRERLAKSADIPAMSGLGCIVSSDSLVEHICRSKPATHTPSETWTAVFSSSNHIIHGYATFGPDLWSRSPEPAITNRIRFIASYLGDGK